MKVFVLTASFFAYVGAVAPPTVNLPLGALEGTTKLSLNGRKFFSFEGVPFARPPVGKYRFREPVPPKPWLGTWKANTIYKCLQYSHFGYLLANEPILGEEDCLYLNIYTPTLKPKKALDVIVYFHGGAFMFNCGGATGPRYIMDKDVVYVSVNYRLGPLGFLTTEDDVVPGNNGLRDQNLALKWVNQNIEYFGGNPNSVTIMGMSAGGASVHLHYLIPESRGLFHRGFSLSGSALCPWVLMEKGAEKTRKLADIVGCDFPETVDMIECIRRRPGREIVEAVEKFLAWRYNPFSPFAVVADTWASEPLLPDHPYNLLKKKQVADLPWISSYTRVEGLYPGAEFYHDEYLKVIDERWNELMPFILDYNNTVTAQDLPEVGQKIRDFYMKDKPVNKETFADLMQAFSDRIFLNDIEKAVRLQGIATKSPIYTYLFNYRGAHSASELLSGTTANLGASHADDVSYLFNTRLNSTTTDEDRKMIQLLLGLAVSFVKDGKPKSPIDWKPVEKSLTNPLTILQINSPKDLKLEQKQSFGHLGFWETLPIKENDKLVSSVKTEL